MRKPNFFPRPGDETYTQEAILKDLPADVSQLGKMPMERAPRINGLLKWNDRHKHLLLQGSLPHGYYDDYLMTVSHSEKIRDLQQNQVMKLRNFLGGGLDLF